MGQDQAISLLPQLRVFAFFFVVVVAGRKTSRGAASILLPSQADCPRLAPGSIRRGKMHFTEDFCVRSSLQSPWEEEATEAGA